MNLLKHYIKEVHSLADVTNEYEDVVQRKLKEPAFKVTMTIDCYGIEKKVTEYFLKSEWEYVSKVGYYMA